MSHIHNRDESLLSLRIYLESTDKCGYLMVFSYFITKLPLGIFRFVYTECDVFIIKSGKASNMPFYRN